MQYGLFVLTHEAGATTINEINTTSIFPNPCNNILHINSEGKELELYDIYGNLIIEKSILYHQETLQIDFLKSGVYLLCIDDKKQTIIKY